ncbi:MAG: TonB-dependent receptor [Povalibacter sp.]
MKIAKKRHEAAASLLASCVALALSPGAARAQQATTAAQSSELEEVVVTGFRGSLNTALEEKRTETGAIDSILAEDIGKFPDSNLAESMQRVPGVTLSRGDGGEGRNISVRGLGPGFTRVRINGMEGASQSGSSDIYGAGNSGRSFDFNVFPSEIFSALTVRKTASADVEEGSLGATVDLRAPRPFDFADDTVFTATGRGSYNTVSEDVDPRASMLASMKFNDGTMGLLGSFAYQKRNIREVGYSAVDILSSNTNGLSGQPFCTPIGFTPVTPSPAAQGAKGATDTLCSTGNPRTSTLAAYNAVANLRRADLPAVAGSGAFLPRLPRYVNSEQDTERMGGTLSFQWAPSENTDIAIDALYSRFDVERRDNYIAGISFGRNVTNNGQPMVSVRDIAFDDHGSVQSATFDGVDVRSEGLVDQFVTDFSQINLDVEHRFSDNFRVTGFAGYSESDYVGKLRLQTFMDAIDTDNFTLDFANGRSTPLIGFGLDVSDPSNFGYGPALADGTVLGGFSTQAKPSENLTKVSKLELNGIYSLNDHFEFALGGQYRDNDFNSHFNNLVPASRTVQALPAGVTLASITRQISGLDDLFGSNAPASWAAVDSKKWRDVFGFDSFAKCGIECDGGKSQIREKISSGTFMVNIDSGDWLPIPVRGDIGVRYVHTNQLAIGYIPVTNPAGSLYPASGQRSEVERTYDDWLPAANVVVEITPDFLARLSAAKVMSRPELGALTPSTTVTGTTRTGNINNPYLEPIRAKAYDAGLEWYFRPGSLLSVAYFYKDIDTFIQRVTTQVPFSSLGLPDSLLNGTGSSPGDIFTVGRISNTDGGPVEGVELNGQVQFDFLSGFWRNFGVLANYTHVTSEIEYILASVPDPARPGESLVTASTTADLTGLSRNSASATLYYENDKLSIRSTASYRDNYIRAIPASPGSDLQGNKPTTYVDASASYNITDKFKVILEGQNLTNERNTLFIDSTREDTLFETTIGRTYSFGATYKF